MSGYLELARVHAPLLLLIVPVIGAALAAALPWPRTSWAVVVIAALLAALVGADMALSVLLDGVVLPGTLEGVPLVGDGIGIFGAAFIALCALLIALAAGAFLYGAEKRTAPFALALMLCVGAGWTGALLAQDLAGVFVAVELAWLAGVGVLALSSERGALNGALRMLGAGGVGAALFLLGAGFIYRSVGSLDLVAIAGAHIETPALAAAGVGLMIVSVALKAGLAPMHDWMGAAFGRAGGLAALTLGVLGVAGALAVTARISVYALSAPELGAGVSMALAALGGFSVVIGSAQAVGARNVRRLAAYAGVAQAGGVLLCVALGSPAGLAAALIQLTAFAAAAMALYGAVAVGRVHTLEALDGLGRRAPLAGAAMTMGAISLMGAPLTLGFLGRWRLVEAGVGAGWWWAAGAVIFASLAGVFYGGRLIERLYFRRANEAYAGDRSAWRFALAPMLVAAIVLIALGLSPGLLLRAADTAAGLMFGGGA